MIFKKKLNNELKNLVHKDTCITESTFASKLDSDLLLGIWW